MDSGAFGMIKMVLDGCISNDQDGYGWVWMKLNYFGCIRNYQDGFGWI